MSSKYRIRRARPEDSETIRELFRKSVANQKNLLHPSMVKTPYLEDFVNRSIKLGELLVVENAHQELELIGEVHAYYPQTGSDQFFREIHFFSSHENQASQQDTELVSWLYREIERKHQDVFNVCLSTRVSNKAAIDNLQQMGIRVEGNYQGRLKGTQRPTILPLSWINPSFN